MFNGVMQPDTFTGGTSDPTRIQGDPRVDPYTGGLTIPHVYRGTDDPTLKQEDNLPLY